MTTKATGETASTDVTAEPTEPAPVKYVATGEIKFGIHAGYQDGDPVSADVVKAHDLVKKGLVKKA